MRNHRRSAGLDRLDVLVGSGLITASVDGQVNVAEDGATVDGRCERSVDGETWETDSETAYARVP